MLMTSRTRRVTSLVLLLLLPLMAGAQELAGRVVRIIDGDTPVLLDATETQHKIRLNEEGIVGESVDEALARALAGREDLLRQLRCPPTELGNPDAPVVQSLPR